MTSILVAIQMASFAVMEVTERLALGENYGAAFRSGVLDAGFSVELIVAIASALLLVALALAVTRVVRAILQGSRRRIASLEPALRIEGPFVRRLRINAGSGGMRAPPTSIRSLPPGARQTSLIAAP